jgi:3-mercaptopropionate dioxygenase
MARSEGAPLAVPEALRRFCWDIQSMVELTDSEREILLIGRDLMARLLASDDWFPPVFAVPDPLGRRTFQLYADGLARFCVLATILAPGQALAPVLDPAWEIIGPVRGTVRLTRHAVTPGGRAMPRGEPVLLGAGTVLSFGSTGRDALGLANAAADSAAIVIHAIGAEMGAVDRLTFASAAGPDAGPVVYANCAEAPPFDIFTIQARIVD